MLKKNEFHPEKTIKPDFILFRCTLVGVDGQDYTNLFFGLLHSGVPTMNNAHSVHMCLQRPIVCGALQASQRKLGKANFPVIPQMYLPFPHRVPFDRTLYPVALSPSSPPPPPPPPSSSPLPLTDATLPSAVPFPCVGKLGEAHAGFGKMRIETPSQFRDFCGLTAIAPNFALFEPFVDWDFDLRIQKIGNHYRAMKRIAGNWKVNVGSALISDVPMTEEYRRWIEEASSYWGGMDICALDVLHRAHDDAYFILELNDTSIGLAPDHEAEDYGYMMDILTQRFSEHYPVPRPSRASDAYSGCEDEAQGLIYRPPMKGVGGGGKGRVAMPGWKDPSQGAVRTRAPSFPSVCVCRGRWRMWRG